MQINIPKKIPDSLHEAIQRAVDSNDKNLLNWIELALVRHLKIQPYPTWNNSGDKFFAAGILQQENRLLIAWRENDEVPCVECDGYGELVFCTKKHAYEFDCRECGGSGVKEKKPVGELELVTDIDGVAVEFDGDMSDFIEHEEDMTLTDWDESEAFRSHLLNNKSPFNDLLLEVGI